MSHGTHSVEDRNESALLMEEGRVSFGYGLFLSTMVLGSFSFVLALHLAFDDLPSWIAPAAVILLAALFSIVLAGRDAIGDLWNTFEPKTKVAMVVVLGAVFSLGTFTAGRQPMTGMAILHVAMGVCLVSPRGFAWYYILTGLTVGTCLLHVPPHIAAPLGAVFLLVLVVSCAYDHFFFTLDANRHATNIPAWLPATVAASRYLITLLIAAPIAYFFPMPDAFLQRPPEDLPEETRRTVDPEQFNMDLLKVGIYTVLLIVLLVVLFALLKYLRGKLRRRGAEILPESIGVPVASPVRAYPAAGEAAAPPANSPRERIAQIYAAFGQKFRSSESRRRPSQTPAEYAQHLENRAVFSRQQVRDITSTFENARYDAKEPDWEEVRRFEAVTSSVLAREPDDTRPD